ncbi:MAG: hypothetical protein JJ863_07845 [Deltaproteobacteria bacterium]|nr:hypothetical protein [Deltaproteobacteria bacterium]
MRLTLGLLLIAALGCEDEQRVAPRGVERGMPVQDPLAAPAPPPTTRRRRQQTPPTAPGPATPMAAEAPAAPAAEGPERDFAAELRSIAGAPASCGSLGPATGPITIRLSATVTSQGVVTRGSATGNVPAEIEACLTSRIEHGRFRAPVEGAPRRVSAELRLEVAEAPSTTTIDTTPMFEPVGVPGTTIAGPSGMDIQGPSGMAIGGPSGTAIGGPSGTPIQGPSGTPIGGSGYGN